MTIVLVPIPSSGAYSSVDGTQAFLRRNAWLKSYVSQEPLTGVVNGINTRFRLQSYPALSGTVYVFDMGGAPVATSSVAADSGSITTVTPPVNTLFANYTHCAYTDAQLTDFFIEGFVLMESLWQRGYALVQSGSVYYVSSSDSAIVDPAISDSTFSARPSQYGLLVDCVHLVWAQNAWNESATNAIAIRESLASGVNLDRTRQPAALRELVENARKRVLDALNNAYADAGVSSSLGEAIEGQCDQYPNVWKTLNRATCP